MKKILQNTFALLSVKEKKQFYWFTVLDVIISVLDIASIALLLGIVNFYSQNGVTLNSSFLPGLFNDKQSVLPVALFLVFFSIKNLLGYLLQKVQLSFVYKVAGRLSAKAFLHYLEGNYAAYAGTDSSVHSRRISQHPVEFAHYVLAGIQQIITQSVLIIASLTAVFWFNPTLFAMLFILLTPPIFAIGFFIRRTTRQARTSVKTTGERTLQYLKEGLAGYIESNLYGKHDFFTQRYAGRQQELNDQLSKLQSIQGLSGRLLEVFAVLGLFLLLVVAKWTGDSNAFNVLVIGAFIAAAYKIMPGVVKILNSSGQVRTYAFTISDLLQTTSSTKTEAASVVAQPISSMAFRNISFRHNGKPVLDDFNCSVKAGDFVGISGASGSGKTTLVNLLLGFLQPDTGNILINDVVAGIEQRHQSRQRIAYVKQQPFLIHDSIIANIVLDEKNIDGLKLDACISATGLASLVDDDSLGLNKLVTEGGKNISGGQRQRIIIARALYKDADLIILDEPFNELDKDSELLMLRHFASLAEQGKIILLVTHSRESLSFCNKLILLDEK